MPEDGARAGVVQDVAPAALDAERDGGRLDRVDLVVLVHRDAPAVVARSLRALAVSMGPAWTGRLVLVQSASPPATAHIAEAETARVFPAARWVVVASPRNLGFAAGVNLGVAHAAAPYVGVFNPDGVTRPETVARLARALDRDGRVFMAGARIVSTAVPAAPPPLPPLPAVWLPGTAVLFRREWFLDVGGFDPGFFMYCEDVDLSRRARARGWKLVVGLDAVFWHARELDRGESLRRIRMWTVSNTSLVYQYGRPRRRALTRLARQRAGWFRDLARRRRGWTLLGALLGSAMWPASIPRLERRRRHPWDGQALSDWLAKMLRRVRVADLHQDLEPSLVEAPLAWTEERERLTLEYRRAHSDPAAVDLAISPRVIVLHHTGGRSVSDAREYFNRERVDESRAHLARAGAVNVSAHFVVGQDGVIQRLQPETRFARHCIGLNHLAIGIENVGGVPGLPLTDAQLVANARLVRALSARFPITHLIGHFEAARLRDHPYYAECDPAYRVIKVDPGLPFMTGVRALVEDLGLAGPPG
jgi:GT2 family glycosyltransferase